ncbi:hypothetical protein DV735_g2976, partial [Chaetothyriales sp. CBS 134920]
MHLTTSTLLAAALLAGGSALAAPAPAPVPTTPAPTTSAPATTTTEPAASATAGAPARIGLTVGSDEFNASYVHTFRLSYANSSAYIGQIKYQTYSEPLVVTNPVEPIASAGLSFTSIHSVPTGWQNAYVVEGENQPLWFSVPHASPPAGAITTGFGFGAQGALGIDGVNRFYVCQDDALDAISTFQVYWFGAEQIGVEGLRCQGPIKILATDAC